MYLFDDVLVFFYVYVVVCTTYMYEDDLTFHELNNFTSIKKLTLSVCYCIEFMNDYDLYFSWTVNPNIFSFHIK